MTTQVFWLQQHFSPVLLGCSTGGLGAQPLLGHGSHSSIFSPTDLNFLSPGLYNNLVPTYFLRASQFALNSTLRQSRLSPDIFDRVRLLFTQVHFFFWQLGRGQYVKEIQMLTFSLYVFYLSTFNAKSSLYIYIKYIWLGLVFWHINHCRLFNAKSSLYIYIKSIWLGLVGFYDISTIVGYSMQNPLYRYILNKYHLVWLGFMAYQPL